MSRYDGALEVAIAAAYAAGGLLLDEIPPRRRAARIGRPRAGRRPGRGRPARPTGRRVPRSRGVRGGTALARPAGSGRRRARLGARSRRRDVRLPGGGAGLRGVDRAPPRGGTGAGGGVRPGGEGRARGSPRVGGGRGVHPERPPPRPAATAASAGGGSGPPRSTGGPRAGRARPPCRPAPLPDGRLGRVPVGPRGRRRRRRGGVPRSPRAVGRRGRARPAPGPGARPVACGRHAGRLCGGVRRAGAGGRGGGGAPPRRAGRGNGGGARGRREPRGGTVLGSRGRRGPRSSGGPRSSLAPRDASSGRSRATAWAVSSSSSGRRTSARRTGTARVASWTEATRKILAGQPTDDSELALCLARSILKAGRYDPEAAADAYAWWHDSEPFDKGTTTQTALGPAAAARRAGGSAAASARAAAARSLASEANGALMRVSPLGVLGWSSPPDVVAGWARADAVLTHANPACGDASALYVVALAHAVRTGASPRRSTRTSSPGGEAPGWGGISSPWWSGRRRLRRRTTSTRQAGCGSPSRTRSTGCSTRRSVEEGVVETVRAGGDTDTNAAIAGALLGAVGGIEQVPVPWTDRVLSCRPLAGAVGQGRVRPSALWPVDLLVVAEHLAWLGRPSA